MSTKTLRKRIALAAVSALGAGFLSVIAGPSANALVYATAETAYIASVASTTGSASTSVGMNTATSVPLATSVGYITASAGSVLAAAPTATGTITSNAAIAFHVASASKIGVTVSGGQFTAIESTLASTSGGHAAIASDRSYAYDTTTGENLTVIASPTAAVGSTMTVTFYQGSSITSTAPTAGTLIGSWTLTIAASSATNVYSSTYSSVYIGASKDKGSACATAPTYDNFVPTDNGKVACIYVDLRDAYNTALSSGTVSASSDGAYVKVNGGASAGYTASSTYSSDASAYSAAIWVAAVQSTANAAQTSTITVVYQGVVVATKTIKWYGDAASIELDTANSNNNFYSGASSYATSPAGAPKGIVYKIKDSAGNAIAWSTHPTISSATGAMASATLATTGDAAAASAQAVQTVAAGYGSTSMYIGLSSASGTGTYKLKLTNGAGTVLYSPAYTATVSGDAASFDASWDKASYKSGDIATLTITAKDSAGLAVADGTAFGSGATISVNSDGFDFLTQTCKIAPEVSAKFSGGKKECKFAVLNTPGSYSYTVKVSTSTGQAEKAGTVSVTSAGGTVSNTEVLAAIVKLIASINKQIAALQKALKK